MPEFLHFNVTFKSCSAFWPDFFSFLSNVFVHKFATNLAVSFPFYCSVRFLTSGPCIPGVLDHIKSLPSALCSNMCSFSCKRYCTAVAL